MEEVLTDLFHTYFDARRNKRNTIDGCMLLVHYSVKHEIFASRFRDRVIHDLRQLVVPQRQGNAVSGFSGWNTIYVAVRTQLSTAGVGLTRP